jgi:hypothetical protein
MSDEEGSALIRKWESKKERAEEADKKAHKDMKRVLSAAMKDDGTHKNIVNELKTARQSGIRLQTREGYGDDGDVITGFGDARPWDRD